MKKWLYSLYCFISLEINAQVPEIRNQPIDTLWTISSDIISISSRSSLFVMPMTEIRSNFIEKIIPTNLHPLLNRTAGIRMESGALNTNRISIRGVGNREPFATSKLKAYLDEIPLTTGIGESSIEDIDPALISSINVWKSPASAIWGAGLGGMVHIKTINDQVPGYSTQIQTGSFGLFKTNHLWTHHWGKGENAPIALQVGYLSNQGYRGNNKYRRFSTSILQQFKASDKLKLKVFTQYINLHAQIPSSLGWSDFTHNPRKAAENWASVNGGEDYDKFLIGISQNYLVTSQLSWKGSIFYNYFGSNEVRPFNNLFEKNQNLGTRQKLHFVPSRKLDLQVGFEFFYELYRWRTWLENSPDLFLANFSENRKYLNTFFNFQYSFSPIQLHLGLNGNITAFTNTDKLDNNYKTSFEYNPILSPMIGIGVEIIPKKFSVLTSLSSGFSPVTIGNAIGSDGSINSNLNPERGLSFDFGFSWQGKYAKIKLDFYRMKIRDQIIRKRINEDEYQVINAGETLHQGVELESVVEITKNINLQSGMEWNNHRFLQFIDDGMDYSGNRLTGSPKFRSWHKLGLKIAKIMVLFDYEYQGILPLNDDNSINSNPYHLFHIQMDYPFFLGNHQLRIGGHVNNLFDRHYASMFQINAVGFGTAEPRYYYPGLPRSFDLYLKIDLNHVSKL